MSEEREVSVADQFEELAAEIACWQSLSTVEGAAISRAQETIRTLRRQTRGKHTRFAACVSRVGVEIDSLSAAQMSGDAGLVRAILPNLQGRLDRCREYLPRAVAPTLA